MDFHLNIHRENVVKIQYSPGENGENMVKIE